MRPCIALSFSLFIAGGLQAAESVTVDMARTSESGSGPSLGSVSISESKYGLGFTPHLAGLEPGLHGFHVHMTGNCNAVEVDGKLTPAGAAGGHWDPDKTGRHGFPWEDDAHRGDLPALYVAADGSASLAVLAPRLKSLKDLHNRALMVHAGADNHADHPQPLGGGGARFACGVIKLPVSPGPV